MTSRASTTPAPKSRAQALFEARACRAAEELREEREPLEMMRARVSGRAQKTATGAFVPSARIAGLIYEVDLSKDRCPCPARTSDCRHRRIARELHGLGCGRRSFCKRRLAGEKTYPCPITASVDYGARVIEGAAAMDDYKEAA